MNKPKYQATESIGDTIVGDIVLTEDQRKLAGRVQNLTLAVEQNQIKFADAIKEIKQVEEELDKFKAQLYTSMEKTGVKTIESDILRITLVAPSKTESLDIKAIKSRDPRLYRKLEENYGKTTVRKGYVKITDKRNRKQTVEISDGRGN